MAKWQADLDATDAAATEPVAGLRAILVWMLSLHTLSSSAAASGIRLHDLRHTHATLALQAGVHPKVVSERLGHATVSITLDTHSHAIPAMQEEVAALMAGLVFATT